MKRRDGQVEGCLRGMLAPHELDPMQECEVPR